MRIIQVKVFYDRVNYFVIIEKIKLKSNIKIIEHEFTKELNEKNEIQYYLTNILNNKEFRKHKIFLNYISNDVIIEVINENNISKNNYLEELKRLYPNYTANYNLLIGEMKVNYNNKKRICALVEKDTIKNINNIISFVGKEKIRIGLDSILLQTFINNNISIFSKKYIILLQKNFNFYRFYQVLNGKIINYIVFKENEDIFNQCLKLIDNKLDELIFEGPYNMYHEFIDRLFNVNITYLEYSEKLKYIDERKIVYGKKKL